MYQRNNVKLPPFKGSRRHPLLVALTDAKRMGVTTADMARQLHVAPQTLWIWIHAAEGSRHFLLPSEQIPTLSRVTGIAPYYFRPDLWPNPEWRFK
jgi:hypothetical protein